MGFFKNGFALFGVLFPVLFAIGVAVISIIMYDSLCRFGGNEMPGDWVKEKLDNLSTLAVQVGALQTTISLVLVGTAIWFGAMQAGPKAFSVMVQGFSSTGLGIAISIVAMQYLEHFRPTAGGKER
jgi:hypothetical protein